MKFRKLNAGEIDARIQQVTAGGSALVLLYKDARCDMRLLDETAGALHWQRSHEVIGGRLYCTVSIYDTETRQWVSKSDVGTESMTEQEKGQASDIYYTTNNSGRGIFQVRDGERHQLMGTAQFSVAGLTKSSARAKIRKFMSTRTR